MQKELFRKTALDRLATPEQLDQRLQVTTRPGWLIAIAVISLLVAGIVWAFASTLPITVSGEGLLVRGDGIIEVHAPASQLMFVSSNVQNGAIVQQGEVLGYAEDEEGTQIPVTSPINGRVIEVRASPGMHVENADILFLLEDSEKPLTGVIYVSIVDSQKVQPGQEVQLQLQTVEVQEFGYLRGTVLSIGEAPVTQQQMLRIIGNEQVANAISKGDILVEVRIALQPTNNASGFMWSSSQGPDIVIRTGMLANGKIVLKSVRPIELVFPNIGSRAES